MKFFTALFALSASLVAAAVEPVLSTDGELSITSPMVYGNYQAGKILPIVYTPYGNTTNMELDIYLESMGNVYPEVLILDNANVTKDDINAVPVQVNGTYYYQHTYNYPIPESTQSGAYSVIFQNKQSKTNTTIPIHIYPC